MDKKEKKKTKNSKRNTIYNIIIVILLIVIAVCAVKLGMIAYRYHKGTKAYKEIERIAGVDDNLNVNWDKLLKENKDVVAWLYLKDTVISYPVVQTDNNDYYLRRLLDGKWDIKGTLFIDYRVEKPFESFNTVIYGHNMYDGSMFEPIPKYMDKESFYKEHKNFDLLTPEGNKRLRVIGGSMVSPDSPMYKFAFYTAEEKQAYIKWIEENNQIPDLAGKPVNADENSKLVTMSTCAGPQQKDRFCLWCVVEPGKDVVKK